MRTYKDKTMQGVYDGYLAAASDTTSFLYYKGDPRRGSATRCAFWNGYNGVNDVYTAKNSLGHAAYMAGQDFKNKR